MQFHLFPSFSSVNKKKNGSLKLSTNKCQQCIKDDAKQRAICFCFLKIDHQKTALKRSKIKFLLLSFDLSEQTNNGFLHHL